MFKMARAQKAAVVSVLLIVSGVAVSQAPPASAPAGKGKFILRHDTTYYYAPLNEDGTVNYVAATNESQKQKLSPQENAAVLVVKVIGPDFFPAAGREQALRALDLTELDPKEQLTPLPPALKADFERAFAAPWNEKQFPRLAQWLKDNEKVLATLDQLPSRRRFYMPRVSLAKPPRLADALVCNLQALRELARVMRVRAMLKAGSNNPDAAVNDLMTIYQLGNLVEQQRTLTERLAGVAIKMTAVSEKDVGKFPLPLTKSMLEKMQTMLPSYNLAGSMSEEWMLTLDAVMTLARNGYVKGVTELEAMVTSAPAEGKIAWPKLAEDDIDYNAVMVTITGYAARYISLAGGAYLDRMRAFQRVDEDIQKDMKAALAKLADAAGLPTDREKRRAEVSQALGQILAGRYFAVMGRPALLDLKAVTQWDLAQLGFVLTSYKADTGKYPAKLDELRGSYLRELPIDLFGNKPLAYKLVGTGYICYSWGPNFKDDGGKPQGDGGEDYDIAITGQ